MERNRTLGENFCASARPYLPKGRGLRRHAGSPEESWYECWINDDAKIPRRWKTPLIGHKTGRVGQRSKPATRPAYSLAFRNRPERVALREVEQDAEVLRDFWPTQLEVRILLF